MCSRYSIIQYVPDPITDERINIGVLAFNDIDVRVHFLSNWERVRNFSKEKNIDYLKDFAQSMRKSAQSGLLFPGDQENNRPRHERLERVAQSWMNSIQFTEPRGSLKDVNTVIEDAVKKFLVKPVSEKSKFRDRQDAARITISNVKKVVREMMGQEYQDLVKKNYLIAGAHKGHNVDIAVANGHPYLAAQGISFEVHPPENLLDAVAWTITDVKDNKPDFPIAVVVLPPKKDESKDNEQLEEIYHNTTDTYRELGAKVLLEQDITSWVTKQLSQQDELMEKISILR